MFREVCTKICIIIPTKSQLPRTGQGELTSVSQSIPGLGEQSQHCELINGVRRGLLPHARLCQ
jgi:hypothetical protein